MGEADRIIVNSSFDDEVTTKQRAHVSHSNGDANKDVPANTEPKKSSVIISYNFFFFSNIYHHIDH